VSAIKELRGQVRQIVKEIFPQAMQDEAYLQLEKKFEVRIKEMEKKQSDLLVYLMRVTSTQAPLKKDAE
jgi:uncharacterized protein YpbB